jgi:hypothetical protein
MGGTAWTYNSGYALSYNGTKLLLVNIPQTQQALIDGNGYM